MPEALLLLIVPWCRFFHGVRRQNVFGELLESGQYAINVELEEAAGYERLNVAQSIWYLYHDLSDEAKEMGFFPSLSEIHSNSFPEETAWLAEQLSRRNFCQR